MPATRPAVKVRGLNRLVRTLREAEREFDIKGTYTGPIAEVMKEAGDMAAAAIRAEAPKRSGRLARSVRAGRAVGRARVSVGRKSVPYAGPIHWGWPEHNIEANKFGTRGLQAVDGQVAEKFEQGMKRVLAKVRGV